MQTYEELQQERDALLLRVHQLSEENRSLRNQLALLQPNTTTNSEILQKHSNLSLAEKILLFQSIFRGRQMSLLADGIAIAPTKVGINQSV